MSVYFYSWVTNLHSKGTHHQDKELESDRCGIWIEFSSRNGYDNRIYHILRFQLYLLVDKSNISQQETLDISVAYKKLMYFYFFFQCFIFKRNEVWCYSRKRWFCIAIYAAGILELENQIIFFLISFVAQLVYSLNKGKMSSNTI